MCAALPYWEHMCGEGKMLSRGEGKWGSEKQVSRIRTGLSANDFWSQKNEKGMLEGREQWGSELLASHSWFCLVLIGWVPYKCYTHVLSRESHKDCWERHRHAHLLVAQQGGMRRNFNKHQNNDNKPLIFEQTLQFTEHFHLFFYPHDSIVKYWGKVCPCPFYRSNYGFLESLCIGCRRVFPLPRVCDLGAVFHRVDRVNPTTKINWTQYPTLQTAAGTSHPNIGWKIEVK